MSELIKVPDLGGEGEVIEILIKEGDQVEAEQSLAVVESDKASMEIPSPKAGKVTSIKFKLGDSLKEGDPLIELEVEGDAQPKQADSDDKPAETAPKAEQKPEPKAEDSKPAASASSRSEAVKVIWAPTAPASSRFWSARAIRSKPTSRCWCWSRTRRAWNCPRPSLA